MTISNKLNSLYTENRSITIFHAIALGLAWDENNYDVIGLEQEIESYEANCFQEQQALYSDFLASRKV